MAQYTPNFNLYEPDSSDDFADFRTEFNNNMDIIDQNLGGGGGSGGHTIYDKDGNALAQESGLQFTGNVNVSDDSVNGKTIVDILGGGGNVYGAFIDPSRVITSGSWTSSLSYTATEDCFVFIDGDLQNTHLIVNVDGVKVYDLGSSSYVEQMQLYPLKKGQALTATKSTNYALNYIVYGITQGTNGIFAPVIYSDNERVIGVWRDNKPLYQKTIVNHSSDVNGTGILIDVSSLNIDSCVSIEGVCDRNVAGVGTLIYEMNSYEDSGLRTYLGYSKFNQNIQYTIRFYNTETTSTQIITIRYTKTTDGAGSGNWNTDGVPTHHYSTSEQVVGTWINSKPVYQRTWTGTKTTSTAETVISGLNDIDDLVDSVLIMKASNGAQVAQYYRDWNDFGRCYLDGTVVKMDLGQDWPAKPIDWRITLRYTKTTD